MLLNSLGRVLVASGLVAVTSFMASTAAFAGTSGTVTLSSSVPTNLTITVSPLPAAGALNLAPTGNEVPYVNVAAITAASTNDPDGLNVTASGTPVGGVLTGTLSPVIGNAAPISYTVGESSTATGSVTDVASNGILFHTKSSAAGSADPSSIFIKYTVPVGQLTGVYQGSITFTAADL